MSQPLAARAGSARRPATAHFARIRLLLGGYLALSALTIVVAALLRHHHDQVNSTVWIRSAAVLAAAVISNILAARAAAGSAGAFRRLRILSGVMIGVIVVIIALPGVIPLWMKLEQGVCGLLLIGVVALSRAARTDH